jgi:hypothetical protein
MLYGNKGAVWTNSVHICETGFNSSTLCGTPMLATNWAAEMEVEKPGCLKCRTIYACKNAKREDLIRVCMNNDHNGVYSDKACKAESMPLATKDDLVTVIMMWVIEENMDEKEIQQLLSPYVKLI